MYVEQYVAIKHLVRTHLFKLIYNRGTGKKNYYLFSRIDLKTRMVKEDGNICSDWSGTGCQL